MTLFSDTRYIFIRYLRKLVRNPILLFFSLFQPIIFLVLFTQLLTKFSSFVVLPGGSYLEFATAGILLQNAFGSALQSGTSIVLDIDSGFLQKMLVTPVRREAILLGRLTSDAFRVVVQSAIILGLAYVQGAFVTTGIIGVLLIFFTIAFFGLSLVRDFAGNRYENKKLRNSICNRWLSYFSTFVPKYSFVPDQFHASWVQTVSNFNPISYAVNAWSAHDDRLRLGHRTSCLGSNWAGGCVITMSATLYLFEK